MMVVPKAGGFICEPFTWNDFPVVVRGYAPNRWRVFQEWL